MYKKLVFYWSPCLDKVGTVKSTLNSAASLNKFSKQNFEVCIINSCGEWNEYDKFFLKNDIKVINLGFNYFKYLPKKGYIQSRFSYFLVFLISFFPLMKILQIKKPDFLIAHLITSLPLSLMQIFNFRTKFILRISGMPKLNFFRKLFWRVLRKKIFLVTAPTLESRESLIKKKIFDSQKIKFLPDAIIDPNYLIKKNINHIFKKFNKKKIIFSAGRLTKQKNFLYLIEEFKNFLKVNDQYILILLGEGEEKEKLKKKVINEKLKENVFLMGHVNNIYDYFRQGELFVLSSLWEDPGFVLIEAAVANLFVVSSNCPNGPKEFLDYGKSGLLYHSNKKGALCKALIDYTNLSNKKKKILQLKKKTLTYTKFRHHKVLRKLLT